MKSKIKFLFIITLTVILSMAIMTMSACSKRKEKKYFGQFGYNENYLTEYAVKEITANEAKILVSKNRSNQTPAKSVTPSNSEYPTPSKTLVDAIITKYASVEITTLYYVTGQDEQKSKIDFLQGTDFKSIIEVNQFVSFSQLLVKGILIFDDLIDYMEEKNADFQNSDVAKISPFKSIFSYHIGADNNIIIQTRDFAEIPSSVGGGIGCSYRQDTEMLYDTDNKLVKWQTSLGVYSATPNGTLQQGYILEVNLNWNVKEY